MPEKFDSCVRQVKRKGKARNAYAVCNAAGAGKKGRKKKAAKRGKRAH